MFDDIISIEKKGLIIVKPANYKCEEKDCRICGLALRDMQDVNEHNKHGCCTECSLYFRQPNTKKWEAGWRPTRKEVEKVIFIKKSGDYNA